MTKAEKDRLAECDRKWRDASDKLTLLENAFAKLQGKLTGAQLDEWILKLGIARHKYREADRERITVKREIAKI